MQGYGIAQRLVGLELQGLHFASGFERLEKLFDNPSGSVNVDDALKLRWRIDRLGCVKQPVDGLGSLRWVRLSHVHDVDLQLLAVALVRLANAPPQTAYRHQRDACFPVRGALCRTRL